MHAIPTGRRFLVAFTLLVLTSQSLAIGSVSAGLTAGEGGGQLYLSCRADNDCVLTPVALGEEQVSDQTSANTFQPEVLTFEFVADPPQDHVALLPESLASLVVDFRHQTEAGSFFRPAMEVRLILGQNVNEWNFEASVLPEPTSTPYALEDESLDLDEGRVLWTDEPVRLIITVTLDRPGSWELRMRASSLVLDVPWSIDAEEANTDEPSSASQPLVTSLRTSIAGAGGCRSRLLVV